MDVLYKLVLISHLVNRAVHCGIIEKQPSYTVLTPTTVRPNQLFKVSATVIHLEYESFTVRAVIKSISYDGRTSEEVCSAKHTFTRPGSYDIRMQTPKEMTPGNYSIVAAGFSDPSLTGQIFSNETKLFYDNKQISVFIITSKPFYNRGETVAIRIVPVQKNLLPITEAMDVRIKNPGGNMVREWLAQHTNAGGVVNIDFKLNKLFPEYGEWTIEVECLKQTFTQNFLLDEYYLPVRYVNVSMPTAVTTNEIGLSGRAECLFTTFRGVRGNATLKLDIISADGTTYGPIVRKIDYFVRGIDFFFSRFEMEAEVGGPDNLVSKELKVTLSVTDWRLNETSSGSQSAIVYTKDVTLQFLEGPAITFKPDQPFKVHIAAQYGDGRRIDPHNPNRTIYVEVTEEDKVLKPPSRTVLVDLDRDHSVAEVWLNPTKTTKRYLLSAKYMNVESTSKYLTATKFWSPSKSYLHITTTTKRPRVEEFMNFDIVTNTFIEKIYYAIVSGGNIILSDSLTMHTRMKQLSIALSRDMIPDAKIVGYFITAEGQVVTDSLNFNVENKRGPEISASINRGKDISQSSVELKIAADPLAYISVSAMEYGLYELGARNGLSIPEVITELYTYNNYSNSSIHHTWETNGQVSGFFSSSSRSFGHDANSTFFYAGLYIFSDANVSSLYTPCNMTKGEFPCMDGSTCYNYKDICNNYGECVLDHRDEMGCLNKTEPITLYNQKHWRSKNIRSHYPGPGFMWSDAFTKPSGKKSITYDLFGGYPTSWVVSVFSMSREHGLSILEHPIVFQGERLIYIKVEAPSSLELNEHGSLSIVVFNRWVDETDVLIVIKGSKDYKPVDWNKETSRPYVSDGEIQVLVPTVPGEERQLYIPIKMMRVGTVTVKIEARSFVGIHKHSQKIKVFHEGIKQTYVSTYQVDLRQANSERTPDFFIPIDESPATFEGRIRKYVAGSAKTQMHVVGDVIGVGFAANMKNYITGRNLIGSPDYSAANAIFTFAVNFYSLNTLRSLSTISSKQRDAIVESLNSALQEILSYLNPDGSYRMFRWSPEPNTWLTAWILEILSTIKSNIQDLQPQIKIPQEAIDRTTRWLANQGGELPGSFKEVGNINNKLFESTLNVRLGDDYFVSSNVSLTALCVIALAAEVSQQSQEVKDNVTAARVDGAEYIGKQVDALEDPFELAIVTYALTIVKHRKATKAMKKLKERARTSGDDMLYWSVADMARIKKGTGLDTQLRLYSKRALKHSTYSVAATSYALLTYMYQRQNSSSINKIQRFLQEHRSKIGGWTGTFDTLLAVRALSQLAERDQDRNSYQMAITFRSDTAPGWVKTVQLHKDNWFIPQTVSIPTHWGSVQVKAKGTGIALVQMKTVVNREHEFQLKTPAANYFDINYSLTTSGFNHSHIHYTICPSWKGPGEKSGAAVVDFTVPGGYAVPNGGTQKFCKKSSKTTSLRNGEFRGSASTGSIYFDYLDRTQNNCYNITANRKRVASNITEHHYIKVYDYFEPTIFNVTIIDRVEFTKLTVCLTCGSYQCPYCPHYAAASGAQASILLLSLSAIFLFFHHTCLL